MSWEAWGTPDYLDVPECSDCCGEGVNEGDDGLEHTCSRCGGTGVEPDQRFDDDVI